MAIKRDGEHYGPTPTPRVPCRVTHSLPVFLCTCGECLEEATKHYASRNDNRMCSGQWWCDAHDPEVLE